MKEPVGLQNIGATLRQARHTMHLSLEKVAAGAEISAATLSRIETGKQALDFGMFLKLANILKVSPRDLLDSLGDAQDPINPLLQKFTGLESDERIRLWQDLAEDTRLKSKKRGGGNSVREIALEVDELMAQIDFLRAEIESLRERLRKR